MGMKELLQIPMWHPDTGCQYSPSCLACPLPVCKYDAPPETQVGAERRRGRKRRQRQAQVLHLHEGGWSPQLIANEVGCTVSNVHYIIRTQAPGKRATRCLMCGGLVASRGPKAPPLDAYTKEAHRCPEKEDRTLTAEHDRVLGHMTRRTP